MANQVKTYFLAPSTDYPPNGLLALGNIILSPKQPVPPLAPAPTAPLPHVSSSKENFTWTHTHSKSVKLGLWTKFVELLNLHASTDTLRTVQEVYSFARMDTTEFFPDESFVRDAMAAPAVIEYLARQRFRKSVYMVVGIKVVAGAQVRTVRQAEYGGGIGGSVYLTLAGGLPFAVGADSEGRAGQQEEVGFTDRKEFVFAFRVRRVLVRSSGRVEQNNHNRNALLAADDDEDKGDEPAFVIDGLEDVDETGEEFQLDGETVAEGEEKVRVYGG